MASVHLFRDTVSCGLGDMNSGKLHLFWVVESELTSHRSKCGYALQATIFIFPDQHAILLKLKSIPILIIPLTGHWLAHIHPCLQLRVLSPSCE